MSVCLSEESEPDPTAFAKRSGLDVAVEGGNWWPVIAGRLGSQLESTKRELEETRKRLDRVRREGRMEIEGVKSAQNALDGVREAELIALRARLE